MHPNTPPLESGSLMLLVETSDSSIVLASDHFETVLVNPCFCETNQNEELLQEKIVRRKPASPRGRTPVSHSAFRLVDVAQEQVTDTECR
jgi:hypothetical protein